MSDFSKILDLRWRKFNPTHTHHGIEHELKRRSLTLMDMRWMAHNMKPWFMDFWPFSDLNTELEGVSLPSAFSSDRFEDWTRERVIIALQSVILGSFSYVLFLDGGCWNKEQFALSIQWSQILDQMDRDGWDHYGDDQLASLLLLAWNCFDNYC